MLDEEVWDAKASLRAAPDMPESSYSGNASSCMSKPLGGDAPEPKTFTSSFCTELTMPYKLRRLATGLPWFDLSKFIVASLRFRAPAVGSMEESLLESSDFRNGNGEGSARSDFTLCRVDLSTVLRGTERLGVSLMPLLFSWSKNLGPLGE